MTFEKLFLIFDYIRNKYNNFISKFNSKKSRYEIYEQDDDAEIDDDQILLVDRQ
jgi:hypothetical protein